MGVHGWLTLIAGTGLLGLASLAVLRGERSALTVPICLLCMALFSWNMADLAYKTSGQIGWHYLDLSVSPFTAPIGLHFIAAFVGRRRELRAVLAAAYLAMGALSLSAVSAFVSGAAATFVMSPRFAVLHLAGAGVAICYAMALLLRHLRTNADPEEQVRARLIWAALLVGGVLGSTELLAGAGLPVPRGGNLAALAAAAILALVALRFRLLERELSSKAAMYSIAVGALAVIAYTGLFYLLASNTAMLVLATATLTLVLLMTLRHFALLLAPRKERAESLVVLGRLSAQMAHDLKNPLAAMKGAAQYLREEQARGKAPPEQAEFVELLVEQTDRILAVIDKYQRLGRFEPALDRCELNEVVQTSVAPFQFASPELHVHLELEAGLGEQLIDRDLIASVIENLLRNAFEAMPSGGTVTVRTKSEVGGGVCLSVEDQGGGMGPRLRERAFDDFFTTKEHGSGLGLSFVRRVAEAHGGTVELDSEVGRGTWVRLHLPGPQRAAEVT